MRWLIDWLKREIAWREAETDEDVSHLKARLEALRYRPEPGWRS